MKDTTQPVIQIYAQSLVAVARDHGLIDAVEKDARHFYAVFENDKNLQSALRHPGFRTGTQGAWISDVARSLEASQLWTNFLNMLSENGRLALLPGMLKAIADLCASLRGVIHAQVTVAQPLSPEQERDLKNTLKTMTGKEVTFSLETDAGLIGGVVVTMGTQRFDGSVRQMLNALRHGLMKAA